MRRTIDFFNSNDFFPSIEKSIEGGVKTFRTKSDALKAGSAFGWRCAVKVARRFETVWIVGRVDFQNSYENDLAFQILRIPMLKYENSMQPILTLRRPIKN